MAIRAKYLDASAAIKLVVDEDKFEELRSFYRKNDSFYCLSNCFSECLSILKVMYLYRKNLTKQEYHRLCFKFTSYFRGSIKLENIDLSSLVALTKTEELSKKYNMDMVDALQLYTLQCGRHSIFAAESASLLITADTDLANAANCENLQVWNTMEEPQVECG